MENSLGRDNLWMCKYNFPQESPNTVDLIKFDELQKHLERQKQERSSFDSHDKKGFTITRTWGEIDLRFSEENDCNYAID